VRNFLRWLVKPSLRDAGTLAPRRDQLPIRLVEAAMSAMDIVRVCGYRALDGHHIIEGYNVDLARQGAGAVLDALADELGETGHADDAVHLHALAQLVREVPALEVA
jgi:hypothetical protein